MLWSLNCSRKLPNFGRPGRAASNEAEPSALCLPGGRFALAPVWISLERSSMGEGESWARFALVLRTGVDVRSQSATASTCSACARFGRSPPQGSAGRRWQSEGDENSETESESENMVLAADRASSSTGGDPPCRALCLCTTRMPCLSMTTSPSSYLSSAILTACLDLHGKSTVTLAPQPASRSGSPNPQQALFELAPLPSPLLARSADPAPWVNQPARGAPQSPWIIALPYRARPCPPRPRDAQPVGPPAFETKPGQGFDLVLLA
mmetsp:Transcript_49433/g.120660  ORF Transcript_49433/g.120660 Transcript_49433/m.120660 type:complete len:266 (+) Transcript_49433:1515-2312(+)